MTNNVELTVAELIAAHFDTWRLLLEYDEDRLDMPSHAMAATGTLDLESVVDAIDAFREDLAGKGEVSPHFGNPRGDAVAAILGNIDQTIFGEPLSRSREEKAAHLLYFVVKDHPFTDGNKRIGAPLLLFYLAREGMAQPLDPRALTALTLAIAESAPARKDLMIRLIVNLMAE